jgi:hypothetical protein
MDYRNLSESKSWNEYQNVHNELLTAIEAFRVHIEIHAYAAAEGRIAECLNQAASFWNLQLYSLQATFFIVMGRIFDIDPDADSIHVLLNMIVANAQIFSRDALTARKTGTGPKPDWLDDYMQNVWVPTAADLKDLKRAVAPHMSKFSTDYLPIRHAFFAHHLPKEEGRVMELFGNTLIAEIDGMLHFLYDLLDAIADLYLNGRKFDTSQFGKGGGYDRERARIRTMTREVLDRLVAA